MLQTKSTAFHNKIAEDYESSYVSNYWSFYKDIAFANIKKYLPRKGSLVLDAGGGTGFWSRKLAKMGYGIVCADIAQKMLDAGKKYAEKEELLDKIEFRKSDILNMKEFADKTFDFVIAEGDPVGYCGNPDKAIKELSRVAKRGAFIIVSVDSFFTMLGRMISKNDFKGLKLLEKKHESITPHGYSEHDFMVDELKNLFVKNRLKVVEVIGKPVLTRFVPMDKLEEMLSDKKFYRKLLDLETKYNNEPSIAGLGGHIQIIGKKM